MSQHVGAIIDKLVVIALGLFSLFAPANIVAKRGDTPEMKAKRVKKLRICGVVALVAGIALLILTSI